VDEPPRPHGEAGGGELQAGARPRDRRDAGTGLDRDPRGPELARDGVRDLAVVHDRRGRRVNRAERRGGRPEVTQAGGPEARPGEALAQRPRGGEADDAAADDGDVVGHRGLRYCIGEKVVGFQILLTTRSTSGPFASVTFRAACHSGSAMNADHARWRWARSSYAQM